MYASSSITLECTRVVIDTDDPEFVGIRFIQNGSSAHTVYLSVSEGKRLQWLRSVEERDQTILVEEVNANAN